MNGLLALVLLFTGTSPFLRRTPPLGNQSRYRTRLQRELWSSASDASGDPADTSDLLQKIFRTQQSASFEKSRELTEVLVSTSPMEFFKLGLREGQGEVTPKYVGEFLSKMVMDKLRRDTMENFFSDEELPAFKSLFFYVSGDAPDDLGMKLADVTLPYLWNIKMNNFLTFLLRPKMVHFAKVVLSHYLINFVVRPWALDMSKRAEMWRILGETRASLLDSPPRAIEDYNVSETNKAEKRELVQGLKDLLFSKLPDPRKKLEKEGPFEMLRSRLNLPKDAPITKEMTSLFLLGLFDDQITYDTAAALFKKIKFPYLGRTLTDPLEELIERRISQLLTPLVIDKFDLLSPEVITKYTTLHVVKPWTVDPKKRAELLELLEISHGFLNPLDVSLLV